MRSAGFNQDPCIREFGISVAENFTKVNARVLEPPSLEYANNRRVSILLLLGLVCFVLYYSFHIEFCLKKFIDLTVET